MRVKMKKKEKKMFAPERKPFQDKLKVINNMAEIEGTVDYLIVCGYTEEKIKDRMKAYGLPCHGIWLSNYLKNNKERLINLPFSQQDKIRESHKMLLLSNLYIDKINMVLFQMLDELKSKIGTPEFGEALTQIEKLYLIVDKNNASKVKILAQFIDIGIEEESIEKIINGVLPNSVL
jgi:hypothetical protein